MAKLHAGMVEHPTCFFAIEQTQGRGQRGKSWLSNPGDNITMSTAFPLSPGISANVTAFPFVLSAAMALGCYDFIKDFSLPNVSIKWPNDIYLGDRKAAGILIENVYRGNTWDYSVVGTGVNINQESFSADAGRAISFKMVAGLHYDSLKLGRTLFRCLVKRFEQLKKTSPSSVIVEYNNHLYKKGELVKFKKGNMLFTATINGVSQSGELITTAATEQLFNVGEVEFV